MATERNLMMKRVHIVFKTHLDVGFTDFAEAVVARYCDTFIPAALDLAAALRQRGGSERFVWTTGSWLIDEYLRRASPTQRQRMQHAIEEGDIVWHGLPFTTHTEAMDADLFRRGLALSQQLDAQFERKTIAAKMTDVPGHTRSMIPYLCEAGIQFLHLGVNPASKVPDVPQAFVWQGPDGAEIVVVYSGGSYGKLHIVDGLEDALYFAHTGDNDGPPSAQEVIEIFAHIQEQFPDAQVMASTLDSFAAKIVAIKSTLPVVREEIGDTWIHGIGSDPQKMSHYRELLRLRKEWQARGVPETDLAQFHRTLLLVPEHTWGLDVKTHLDDFAHYAAAEFSAARKQDPRYARMETSWEEQRAYLTQSIAALETESLQLEVRDRLRALTPQLPSKTAFISFDPTEPLDSPFHTVQFHPQTGELIQWIEKRTQRTWCSPDKTIGRFQYESFSQVDYDRWLRDYNINLAQTREWAIPDFSKPGMDDARPRPQHQMYLPNLTEAHVQQDGDALSVILTLQMPNHSTRELGAPRTLTLQYLFQEQRVEIRLQWFEKSASRLPEASWFSFNPRVDDPQAWLLEKLGYPISPLDVINNGNRTLHAIDRQVVYKDDRSALAIESLDAPLVAPGAPRLLQFDNTFPQLENGLHFNLHNNVWGTNFRMWYDDDALFRFVLWLG